MSVDSSYASNTNATKYSPTISGTSEYYSQNGVFVVDSLAFTGTPGEEYKLVFATTAIDSSKPSNKEYMEAQNNNSDTTSSSIDFDVNI